MAMNDSKEIMVGIRRNPPGREDQSGGEAALLSRHPRQGDTPGSTLNTEP